MILNTNKFYVKFGVILILMMSSFSSIFGQEIISEKFEPNVISNGQIYEFGSAISKDYKEIYFGIRLNSDWKAEFWGCVRGCLHNSRYKRTRYEIGILAGKLSLTVLLG